jgi:hypothetical protein
MGHSSQLVDYIQHIVKAIAQRQMCQVVKLPYVPRSRKREHEKGKESLPYVLES